ncbi:hypothetical protein [Azospirillum brasilense]|uniref:Uncharacterized protein n=1 Tax=Azospirillum brasilense TaxID=192 RepID=A0A235H9M5_AZOBR|nr:hypothetical protein [Azospirillum brasilense]OYD82530.1 hypothetical protein CHT98_20245 [Azospirillum brasilense]
MIEVERLFHGTSRHSHAATIELHVTWLSFLRRHHALGFDRTAEIAAMERRLEALRGQFADRYAA